MSLLKIKYTLLFLAIITMSPNVQAKFNNWHTTNIQLLKGWDYEVGEEGRAIITLEHVNDWKYGDFYMFIDGTRFDSGKTKAYSETVPRFSLSKVIGKDLSYDIVKEILVSTMFEKGKGSTKTYLYGGAIDLDIPGFKFVKTNFFILDNPNIQNENTWQITVAWNSPIQMKGQKFLFEGVADFVGDKGATYHANHLLFNCSFNGHRSCNG